MTDALIRNQTYRNRALRGCGALAAHLHTVALLECAAVDGDGVLDQMMVKDAANLYDLASPRKLAAKLVAAGVWHDPETLQDCDECLEHTDSIRPGCFLIHDWWTPLLDEKGRDDKVHRMNDAARTWLKRTAAGQTRRADVRRRDQNECQYCGIYTRWDDVGQDRKSNDLGNIDHVNPFLGSVEALNATSNLVVACRGCNIDKGQRTPAQWANAGGRLLRRAPGKATDPAWVDHRSITDPVADRGTGSVDRSAHPPRVARESGPITDPVGSEHRPAASDHGSPLVSDRVPMQNGHRDG